MIYIYIYIYWIVDSNVAVIKLNEPRKAEKLYKFTNYTHIHTHIEIFCKALSRTLIARVH